MIVYILNFNLKIVVSGSFQNAQEKLFSLAVKGSYMSSNL